jgi:hypothetical protein
MVAKNLERASKISLGPKRWRERTKKLKKLKKLKNFQGKV